LADFVAAVDGSNLGGGNTGAAKVEWQVIDWLTDMVGFPKGAGGILTSSGSQANLNCLVTARNKMASVDVRKAGIGALPKPMRFYASQETHSCVAKALEVMGHGAEALRLVPVNDQLAMDPAALPGMIAEDRAAGFAPVCVIGTAGATNTGAIDDLVALSRVARDEGLWFHVDGCVGAVVKLSHLHRNLVDGLEMADSVALDLHKWLQVPFGVGAAVVRRKTDQSDTFAAHGDYLEMKPRGLIVGDFFGDYGIDLSRGLSALKVWMTFKEQGRAKIGRMIDHTIELARGAAARAEAEPQMERMAPCPINVACFRFWDASLSDAALDAINNEIMLQLQEDGSAVMSDTQIGGEVAIRMAISNHRTVKSDVDEVLDLFVARGQKLLAEGFADGVAAE
jgi:glutamate/tyrosine decarboxylase-like PLP-dependent enzyme